MAATFRGRQLTELHRRAQLRLGAATIRQMRIVWRLMDPADLDASFAEWLRVSAPIISQQHQASTALAASYMSAYRASEIGLAAFTPIPAEPISAKALITSMTVTGPVAVKVAMSRGETAERAMAIGETLSAGAAMRWALAGGRDTILESMRADREVFRWARATSGTPCAFCAMLASRGAVYRSEQTAGFQAHDSCACFPEPAYSPDAPPPAGTERFHDLWEQSDGTLEDFRRIYERN